MFIEQDFYLRQMDVHTKEQRSRNMKAIKNKNTKIEMILGKAMWWSFPKKLDR